MQNDSSSAGRVPAIRWSYRGAIFIRFPSTIASSADVLNVLVRAQGPFVGNIVDHHLRFKRNRRHWIGNVLMPALTGSLREHDGFTVLAGQFRLHPAAQFFAFTALAVAVVSAALLTDRGAFALAPLPPLVVGALTLLLRRHYVSDVKFMTHELDQLLRRINR